MRIPLSRARELAVFEFRTAFKTDTLIVPSGVIARLNCVRKASVRPS
jgi:hypothetical protein